jgi:hypothetical protein
MKPKCHNFNLGLETKVMACKGVDQERSLRVTPHVPENVGKCERMNPTPPNELPLWDLEFQWTSKFSKSD